jgi:hypothetical protein
MTNDDVKCVGEQPTGDQIHDYAQKAGFVVDESRISSGIYTKGGHNVTDEVYALVHALWARTPRASQPAKPSVSVETKDAEQWRTTFYLQRKGRLPEWIDETAGHKRLEDSLACVQYSKSTADRPLRVVEIKQRTVMDQAAIDAATQLKGSI